MNTTLHPSSLFLLLFALLSACNGEKNPYWAKDEMATADTTVSTQYLHATVQAEKTLPDRKFVRTADFRFEVKNVEEASFRIEQIVQRGGGFVSFTQTQSRVDQKETGTISPDSSLETTLYTVQNSLTFRVPNTQLDSVLHSISYLIDNLDERTVRAEDVSLQILAHTLTQKRIKKQEKGWKQHLNNDDNGWGEQLEEEEWLDNKSEKGDQAYVANLSLEDQVRFSTVTMDLYQRQKMRKIKFAHYVPSEPYQPGFFSQIGEALKDSGEMITALFVGLVRFWWVVGTMVGTLYLFRKKRWAIKGADTSPAC